jgi:hypothetical protein
LADWLEERLDAEPAVPDEDAALRTIIGRAYYAAFHVAKAFIDGQVRTGVVQWPQSRRSVHDKVWEALTLHPDVAISSLAALGERFKVLRTEADYSFAPNKRRRPLAQQARRYARQIVRALDTRSPASN